VLPVAALLLGLAAGQADPWEEEGLEEEDRDHVSIAAWGGNAWEIGRPDGRSAGLVGAEVAYVFRSADVGVAFYAYDLPSRPRPWTPVTMLRIVNRFDAGRGLEATFGFGIGAARPDDWEWWFQVALGVRYDLGPMFVGGELAFEQYDLLHLAGGVGIRF
jgi:hypothetical protein